MRAVNTRNGFHLPAKSDLGLEHLWVVYPGSNEYSLDEATDAVPLAAIKRVADDLKRRDVAPRRPRSDHGVVVEPSNLIV